MHYCPHLHAHTHIYARIHTAHAYIHTYIHTYIVTYIRYIQPITAPPPPHTHTHTAHIAQVSEAWPSKLRPVPDEISELCESVSVSFKAWSMPTPDDYAAAAQAMANAAAAGATAGKGGKPPSAGKKAPAAGGKVCVRAPRARRCKCASMHTRTRKQEMGDRAAWLC